MSAIKNAYFDEINAQPDGPDDSDWEYFQHCNEQAELELDAAGTSDEPVEIDEEFDHFEGSCEAGLRSTVLDLLGIGWTLDRVNAVVQAVAKDAKAA